MPKMIRVRSKITGQETEINELAYGAFAAYYDRIDDAPVAEAEQPSTGAEPSGRAATAKTTRRGTAQSEKE